MAAPTENAPSTQGSSEPPQTSAKTRSRFLDRITGGYRYRLIYWIIALISLILTTDYFMSQHLNMYFGFGSFNPTTGAIRIQDQIYGITIRTTYQDSFWTPIAKKYIPPGMRTDKWYFTSGEGFSLLSRTHADGHGGRLMMDAKSLLHLFELDEYSPEAKAEAIIYFVKASTDYWPQYHGGTYIGPLQDAAYDADKPVSVEVVRKVYEEWARKQHASGRELED